MFFGLPCVSSHFYAVYLSVTDFCCCCCFVCAISEEFYSWHLEICQVPVLINAALRWPSFCCGVRVCHMLSLTCDLQLCQSQFKGIMISSFSLISCTLLFIQQSYVTSLLRCFFHYPTMQSQQRENHSHSQSSRVQPKPKSVRENTEQ